MFSLLHKEVNAFLNSFIGYIVIVVFLLTVSLFMWVFPNTEFNLLDNGYATIDSLFVLAPWVFMFLIPAITMRSFAEEKKSGTIEILLTKPLTDFQIVLAKYTAGIVLVLFALLPTLLFYFSIYKLGSPAGNIDSGGAAGSYIGLLLLASAFVSIGVFASSVTENQIVAFILSLFLIFVVYAGFDSLSGLALFGSVDNIIQQLGINYHYTSLSRGVIDTRDVIYFLSLNGLFLLLTKTVLESRKW